MTYKVKWHFSQKIHQCQAIPSPRIMHVHATHIHTHTLTHVHSPKTNVTFFILIQLKLCNETMKRLFLPWNFLLDFYDQRCKQHTVISSLYLSANGNVKHSNGWICCSLASIGWWWWIHNRNALSNLKCLTSFYFLFLFGFSSFARRAFVFVCMRMRSIHSF